MRKSRFTEEQIIKVLKEHAAGLSAGEVCRKHGISDRDVLQVAIALWRDGGLRRPQAEGAGGREPQAEEAAGGDDAGCIDAEGDARKKLLTPSLRRRAVTWAIREKGYSQRRACRARRPASEDLSLCLDEAGRSRASQQAAGAGVAAPAVRLSASWSDAGAPGHQAQSQEALSALQGRAADRAQARRPQAGSRTPRGSGQRGPRWARLCPNGACRPSFSGVYPSFQLKELRTNG